MLTAACRDPSEGGADDGELGKIIDVYLRLHVFLQSTTLKCRSAPRAEAPASLLGVLLRPPPPPEKKAAGASADDELAGGQRSDDDASDESDDDGDAKVEQRPGAGAVATMDLLGDLLGDAQQPSPPLLLLLFLLLLLLLLSGAGVPDVSDRRRRHPFVPGAMIMDPTSKGAGWRRRGRVQAALGAPQGEDRAGEPQGAKKVPVPSGLDLSVAVNRAAMDAVSTTTPRGTSPASRAWS